MATTYPTTCRLGHRLNAFRTGFVRAPVPYPATSVLGHRLNAFRLGYVTGHTFLTIDGVRRPDILVVSLRIADQLNEVPNTLTATVRDAKPIEGQTIAVRRGSLNGEYLFRGTILRVTRVWPARNPAHVLYHVEATDPTWGLQGNLFSARYRNRSATDIARDLVTRFAPAYTIDAQSGLPVVDEITFTNATVMDAVVQLAKRIGGYARCDYRDRVHLFTTANDVDPPRPLRPGHPSLNDVSYVRDLTQIVTRAIVEGGGVNALAPVAPGSPILPVESIAWYAAGGGIVRSGPQRITYTGLLAGGAGAYAGTGVTPTNPPTLVGSVGAGPVEPGAHSYAYTFVTAAGETLPSPLKAITIGAPVPGLDPAPALNPRNGVVSGLVIGTAYTYAWAWSYVDADSDLTSLSALSAPRAQTCQAWQGSSGAAAPSTAVTATRGSAGPIEPGVHQYAYTFTTATGETLPAPVASVTLGPVPAPSGAPSLYQVLSNSSEGSNPALGYVPGARVRFAAVYMSDSSGSVPGGVNSGSSAIGPASAEIVLQASGFSDGVRKMLIAAPTTGDPLAPTGWLGMSIAGGPWYRTNSLQWGNRGAPLVETGGPTGPAWTPVLGGVPVGAVALSNIAGGGSTVTGRKLYRTTAGGSVLKLLATLPDTTTATYADTTPDAGLGATAPIEDVSQLPGGIAVAAFTGAWDPAAKRVIVWRDVAGAWYRVLVLPVGAAWPIASATDVVSDAAILADPAHYPKHPAPQGSALAGRVSVSGIAVGPAAVTARKLYRTAANLSALKLLATIANNTATTYGEDLTADAGLGAAAPVIDTGGLTSAATVIPAGATALPVTSTAPFPPAGWVIVGSQVIRYTGLGAGALTGIPPSGDGAILSPIAYGTPVATAPALTGIPAAGAGAVTWAIAKGDPVNLVVIVDDTTAQAALAAVLGHGDGVRESLLQDGRIGLTEAAARGRALLAAHAAVLETIAYTCRDPGTRSGALVAVDLPAPMDIRGQYRAQDVSIDKMHPLGIVPPTYTARLSSQRFTFEDLVRRLTDRATAPATGEDR